MRKLTIGILMFIALSILNFISVSAIEGTSVSNKTCVQNNGQCCFGEVCAATNMMCARGMTLKFLGCSDNCIPKVECINSSIVCPQYMPPGLDWCKNGKIIDGSINSDGCRDSPKCVLNTTTCKIPSCNGNNPVNSGKIDSNGCKVYSCETNTDTNVCCEIFGYGAMMVKTASTYTMMPKSKCAVCTPDSATGTDKCIVGGGRNIVDNSYCAQNTCVSIPNCTKGQDAIDSGKTDSNGCKVYTCTTKTCPVGCTCNEDTVVCQNQIENPKPTGITVGNVSIEHKRPIVTEVRFEKGEISLDGVKNNETTEVDVEVNNTNMTVSKDSEGWTIINSDGELVKTKSTLVGNANGLFIETASGREKIEIFPTEAAQKAKDTIGDNQGMTIVESKEGTKYVSSSEKKIRILGIIPTKATYTVSVDTKTGVTKLSKPWYTSISTVAK